MAGRSILVACLLLLTVLPIACEQGEPTDIEDLSTFPQARPAPESEDEPSADPGLRFEQLRAAILKGQASQAEVDEALADTDRFGLVNVLVFLYVMREQSWVEPWLRDVWLANHLAHPKWHWEVLGREAARVAAAHTLVRMNPADSADELSFIRAALTDPDEFARAQAAVALGFVGDDSDVPRLMSVAANETDYDAQAAIKSLAVRGSEAAREGLLTLKQALADRRDRNLLIQRMLVEGFPP